MADIRPFAALRPRADIADKIAALPYDVYSRKEAYDQVKNDGRLTFLGIDRPETQFEPDVDMYADFVYKKADEMLSEMIKAGEFVFDDQPCYYIYELTMDGRSQTGIVAAASVDDYLNQTIKKHENTREEKEQDRIRHVDTCSAQTGPIFLAYRARADINAVVSGCKGLEPVNDFTSSDGIRHRVWVISDTASIEMLRLAFKDTKAVYIADGHHRCASAVKVACKRREEHPDYTGEEEFNYFLSVLFPDEQLMIMDYNRAVRDLNGLSSEEFLNKVSECFEIGEGREEQIKPSRKGEVAMLLDGKWYLLNYKKDAGNDPVESLDVSILQKELLAPVLGIGDPRTDSRIDFIGGIRGLSELERRCGLDCRVAFAMYPTSIAELFSVADANLLMPPKSTWFEPKLRSGLFIHKIER